MRPAEHQLDLPIQHSPEDPAGRKYLNIQDRQVWTIELEIGGAVWLSNSNGDTRQCSMADLDSLLWERQHS